MYGWPAAVFVPTSRIYSQLMRIPATRCHPYDWQRKLNDAFSEALPIQALHQLLHLVSLMFGLIMKHLRTEFNLHTSTTRLPSRLTCTPIAVQVTAMCVHEASGALDPQRLDGGGNPRCTWHREGFINICVHLHSHFLIRNVTAPLIPLAVLLKPRRTAKELAVTSSVCFGQGE